MAWVKVQPVEHYENFPVASWLCPPALRAPIAAIYHFARTADDMADEGDAPATRRLADLAEYRADLMACAGGGPSRAATRWPQVFVPLTAAITQHQLPLNLLADLLSAFEQDVRKTDAGETYRTRDELLHYCARSANPVGRLLLHLWGIDDERSLQQSDAICTALQLINFWQDLGATSRADGTISATPTWLRTASTAALSHRAPTRLPRRRWWPIWCTGQ